MLRASLTFLDCLNERRSASTSGGIRICRNLWLSLGVAERAYGFGPK